MTDKEKLLQQYFVGAKPLEKVGVKMKGTLVTSEYLGNLDEEARNNILHAISHVYGAPIVCVPTEHYDKKRV